MNSRERGFLLPTSHLSDPNRHPLSVAQLRILASRASGVDKNGAERELELSDLVSMGYGSQMAQRILSLLGQEDVLEHYLNRGRKADCIPIIRVSDGYPLPLRKNWERTAPAACGQREMCPF